MEFSKSQIDGLVLGYLLDEGCTDAYKVLIKSCKHFKHKMGKYVPYRVGGMSLEDLLTEYSAIYSIVQGRLERTNYYKKMGGSTTLTDRVIYLLQKSPLPMDIVDSSTPLHSPMSTSEVEATPVDALPGNSSESSEEPDDKQLPSTPVKKKSTLDVSEVLTQTLLDKQEFCEKLAETINVAMSTPEVPRPSAVDNNVVGASAAKELDALIKNVLDKTNEDPNYNKLMDDIIGASAIYDHQPKKSVQWDVNNAMEDVNNDAVRSIMSFQATSESQPMAPGVGANATNSVAANGEVYLFDGTLDSFLKSSGAVVGQPSTAAAPSVVQTTTSSLVLSTGLIVGPINNPMITDSDIMSMPTVIVNENVTFVAKPPEVEKKIKIVPLVNESSKIAIHRNPTKSTAITSDYLIFNDNNPRAAPPVDSRPPLQQTETTTITDASRHDNKEPMADKTAVGEGGAIRDTPAKVAAEKRTGRRRRSASSNSSSSSAARNLDFSTPSGTGGAKKDGAWDADLRSLTAGSALVTITPKSNAGGKKSNPKKGKGKKNVTATISATPTTTTPTTTTTSTPTTTTTDRSQDVKDPFVKLVTIDGDVKVDNVDGENRSLLKTPVKECPMTVVPKTPAPVNEPTVYRHETPFNDVLDEHLKGVDLISLPTPQLPITPGFNLTPLEVYNRPTDYSTSSSYYQPSDTEQNLSVGQLIEECKKTEIQNDKSSCEVKILSNVVIKSAEKPAAVASKKSQNNNNNNNKGESNQHLNKFNREMVGRKNLSLVRRLTSSSTSSSSSDSSSSSSSDSDMEVEKNSNAATVIFETARHSATNSAAISDILRSAPKIQSEPKRRVSTLKGDLEAKRKNIIEKLQTDTGTSSNGKGKKQGKKRVTTVKKTAKSPRRVSANNGSKKSTVKSAVVKKSETRRCDDEQEKLVSDLWQRGIHLMPNKQVGAVAKAIAPPTTKTVEEEQQEVIFDRMTYEDPPKSIIFNEGVGDRLKLSDYDLKRTNKKMMANVWMQHLNKEVVRVISCTQFDMLMDLPCEINILTPRRGKKSDPKDDELYNNHVFTTTSTAGTKEGNKRKRSLGEPADKSDNNKKKITSDLLKHIDVDHFLDQVHSK